MIKPPPLRPAVPGGFTLDDFTIDDQAGTVTCPAGHAVALGRPHADGTRQAQFKALCRGCPLRQRCTTSKTGRVLSVHPQHALLAAARRAAADPAWKDGYRRWRPPVERAIAWLVARGNRRVPYRGITNNNAWLPTGPPPSTSAGWSTSGSPAPPTAPGHSHSASSHRGDTVSAGSPGPAEPQRRQNPGPTPIRARQTKQDFQWTSRRVVPKSGRVGEARVSKIGL